MLLPYFFSLEINGGKSVANGNAIQYLTICNLFTPEEG